MKFYYRYPDRALAGMAALTPAQRGIYNSVIDLLYSCDGIVPCMTEQDDRAIAKHISVDARTWRAFKRQLMILRKIRVTTDGMLDANGVKEGRIAAESHSETQRKRVSIRWQNYKKAKENKPAPIPRPVIPIDIDKEYSSTNSESEIGAAPSKEVAEEEHALAVSGELEALVQAKGWVPPKPLPSSAINPSTQSIPVSDELRAIIRRQNAQRKESN